MRRDHVCNITCNVSLLFHLLRVNWHNTVRMASFPLHFDLLIRYDACFEISSTCV